MLAARKSHFLVVFLLSFSGIKPNIPPGAVEGREFLFLGGA